MANIRPVSTLEMTILSLVFSLAPFDTKYQ